MDTSPLSHFARQQWLSILRAVAGDRRVVIPDTVHAELRHGASQFHHLQAVLDADWIHVHELTSDDEILAFARYSELLVDVNGRNIGEAGVLALAQTHDQTAIIDDRVARKAAQESGVFCQGTLGLLCEAIRDGLLTVPLVSEIADDLIRDSYRLPFAPGEFASWAIDQGLLTTQNPSS